MRALALVITAYEKVSGVSGYLRPEPAPVDRSRPVRVAGTAAVAEDVVEVCLEPTDGRPLPRWQPGCHVDLVLASGLQRQYSLCGDPHEREHYRIAVRRIGTGSQAVHALRPGDTAVVRGPRNAFPFLEVERYLFLAGGIGITAIRPMVEDAARRGADWRLVYTGRSRASMPFVDELVALDPHRVQLWPDDECGVPDAGRLVALAPAGAALYACGPPPMLDAVRRAVDGSPVASLHTERFSPPPVVGGNPFELVLAARGRVVRVGAEESALEAVRRVLPDVAYSCRQGFCGTCAVSLLGGAVEHRDRCLAPAERPTRFALCVSRGQGRVTLDL